MTLEKWTVHGAFKLQTQLRSRIGYVMYMVVIAVISWTAVVIAFPELGFSSRRVFFAVKCASLGFMVTSQRRRPDDHMALRRLAVQRLATLGQRSTSVFCSVGGFPVAARLHSPV